MVVLIIFPVILQTDINVIMLSIGGQGGPSLATARRLSLSLLQALTNSVLPIAVSKQVVTKRGGGAENSFILVHGKNDSIVVSILAQI